MSDRSIQEAIQKLAGTHLNDSIHICAATVTAVDVAARTCTCEAIGGKAVTELGNVQLMPEVNDGLLLIPAIDSTVIVQWSTRNEPFILMFSELKTATLSANEGIQFQGGELGGIPISDNVKKHLNFIENAFNLLNAKVNVLAPTPVIPNLILTAESDIANDFIRQGGA